MSAAARPYATRDWRAIGATLAMLGVCAGIAFIGGLSFLFIWLIGGRFTIDGTAGSATLLAQFIGAPWRIATPLPWQQYVAALPIPLAASAVEFGVPTVLAVFRPPRRVVVAMVVVWCIVSGLDLATTIAGTGIADTRSHWLRQWLAATTAGRGIVTGIITFLPELLASALITLLSSAWAGVSATWNGGAYDAGSRDGR